MASPQIAWQIVKIVSGNPRLKVGLISLGGCVLFRKVLYYVWFRWQATRMRQKRRNIALARKQSARNLCKDAEEIDLSNQTAERLVKAIKSGNISAEEVLNAFTKKALDVDDKTNAITEPVLEAWHHAKMLDSIEEKTGLLHGIPVSIKESFHIGGYDCTGGMSVHINKICVEDAVVVKVLKKQGAVPFMRTNIPQTLMSYCAKNPLYGETLNPHNSIRCPGGSSSGEGALVGAGGSIIGIGSDVGGSIRVPACFCGAFGLKTTSGRLSLMGTLRTSPGRLSIQSSVGLIARDLESLLLLSKVMMSKDMWTLDSSLPQLPFNQQEFNKTEGLRIGYYTYDGNIQCQPPIIRAVMEAKEALERKGHILVPVDFPSLFAHIFHHGNSFIRLMAGDRGQIYRKVLEYDTVEDGVRKYMAIMKLPRWLLQIIGGVLSLIDPFLGRTVQGFLGYKSMHEYFSYMAAFVEWRENFMETWTDNDFDALICPVFPSPAPKTGSISNLTTAGVYCQLYNSLNYPAGSVPVTKVTKEDVAQTLDPSVYKPQNYIEKLLLKDAQDMEGLPVGVQCVALPYRDEMCLRVMRDIDSELRS